MLTKETTGLLIVDVQGRLAELLHNSAEVLAQARVLIEGAKLFGLPIVWVEQLPEKIGATHESIRDLIPTKPLRKATFSAWQTDSIRAAIEQANCKNWLVMGGETHVCVYQTVSDLLAAGLNVHLVTDVVGSRTKANRDLGISAMQQRGVQLTSVEMALFELQRVAEGDAFKQLIKLIK